MKAVATKRVIATATRVACNGNGNGNGNGNSGKSNGNGDKGGGQGITRAMPAATAVAGNNDWNCCGYEVRKQ